MNDVSDCCDVFDDWNDYVNVIENDFENANDLD